MTGFNFIGSFRDAVTGAVTEVYVSPDLSQVLTRDAHSGKLTQVVDISEFVQGLDGGITLDIFRWIGDRDNAAIDALLVKYL